MPSTPRPPPPRPGVPTGAGLALAGVLLAAACGTSSSAGGTASATALSRTGGVAGFADRLEVGPDGHVTGSTRSASVDCRVPAETVRTLATAPPPTVAPAAGTDRMTVTLRRDTGRVDLGEAQGGDPLSTTARTLLDDVQLPPGQRTLCR